MGNKAVFLDRDGTVNEEVNYLGRLEDLRLLPRADTAIRLLKEHGWLVVLITNQSGVGRGYYTEQVVTAIHERIQASLAQAGAGLDGIYYCPHHPGDDCACRKPQTLLFEQAAQQLDINLANSYAIGDKVSDLVPGERLGCGTILVLTGHGQEHLEIARQQGFQPDHVVSDLYQAVEWIIRREDSVRL